MDITCTSGEPDADINPRFPHLKVSAAEVTPGASCTCEMVD